MRVRRRGRRRAIQVPLWSPCLGALGLDRWRDHTPILRIERCSRRNGRIACRDCGLEAPADDLVRLCACGSADVDVIAGEELTVVAVELEKEPTCA